MYSRNVRAYVRVCHAQECQFDSRALTIEVEDREERRFFTMEGAENSGAGPPLSTCFAELSAKRSCRVGNTEKEKATKSMYERSQVGKKRTRVVQKKKPCCGESSQARYKLCSHSTVVLLELSRTARRKASWRMRTLSISLGSIPRVFFMCTLSFPL